VKSDRTTFLTPESVSPKWYVIDAEGMVVGRLASKISQVLMGKHRPDFTPHVVSGDYVVVVNADKVRFTGSDMQHPDHDYYTTKMAKKSYFHHSGWVGGLKEQSALNLWKKDPTAILGLAIRRMLPKGAQNRRMMERLKMYAGASHPHQAQQPQELPGHLVPASN